MSSVYLAVDSWSFLIRVEVSCGVLQNAAELYSGTQPHEGTFYYFQVQPRMVSEAL